MAATKELHAPQRHAWLRAANHPFQWSKTLDNFTYSASRNNTVLQINQFTLCSLFYQKAKLEEMLKEMKQKCDEETKTVRFFIKQPFCVPFFDRGWSQPPDKVVLLTWMYLINVLFDSFMHFSLQINSLQAQISNSRKSALVSRDLNSSTFSLPKLIRAKLVIYSQRRGMHVGLIST